MESTSDEVVVIDNKSTVQDSDAEGNKKIVVDNLINDASSEKDKEGNVGKPVEVDSKEVNNDDIASQAVLMHTDSETSTEASSISQSAYVAPEQTIEPEPSKADGATEVPVTSEVPDSNENPSIYHVKWINWRSART